MKEKEQCYFVWSMGENSFHKRKTCCLFGLHTYHVESTIAGYRKQYPELNYTTEENTPSWALNECSYFSLHSYEINKACSII